MGLTHEEIAQVIGASRETVTRLLTDFRKKKLATLRGATLLVHDKAGLEALVGS
jgi:CRP/FNR family transcriptional regulator